MKYKNTFCIIICFLFVSFGFLHAQSTDVSIVVKNTDCIWCKKGEIVVTINKNIKVDNKVFLYKGNPLEKSNIITSQKTDENNQVIFSNLKKGEYYISVGYKKGTKSKLFIEEVTIKVN